jgi:hypothetical protein
VSNTYKLGTSVRARVVFRDVDGELIDPATVVCMVKKPDGAETSYTYGVDAGVVRDEAAVYHFWIATPDAGTYAYRWKGIDAVEVDNEDTFEVDESAFATP